MSDDSEIDARHVANLVMLVGRLVQQVRKHDSDNPVVAKAMDYLRRCDLTPSIVRGVSDPGDNDVAKELNG